jgi:hypothetical protein
MLAAKYPGKKLQSDRILVPDQLACQHDIERETKSCAHRVQGRETDFAESGSDNDQRTDKTNTDRGYPPPVNGFLEK